MKRLTLIREKAGQERTFGSLFHRDRFVCHTLEPGDADVGAPRVEPGFYHLTPHGWEPNPGVRYPKTWALNGARVSHQSEPNVPRYAVLIHPGNTDDNTRGCILVGLGRGEVDGEPAVTRSREAVDALRDLIGNSQAYLTIVEV